MRVRLPIAALVLTLTFAAGAAVSLVHDAHAQAAPLAATVYVPSDGVAFRTFDGRIVARLSYDAHGGIFELYDDHEQAAMRLRGEPATVHAPGVTSAAPVPKRADDYGF